MYKVCHNYNFRVEDLFQGVVGFCTAKETINKMKRQPTECEKELAN